MSLIRKHTGTFPSIWNDILTPDWFGGTDYSNTTFPAVNILENESGFILEFAIPGQQKEDFTITIEENVLMVSMDQKDEQEENKVNYTRREFKYSAFKRAFNLPDSVNEDAIVAQYENGILRFSLPKKQEALPRPKRLIEVMS